MTISEMANALGIQPKAVERRLQRAGFKPITREAIYSTEAFEAIREVPGKGRPPKAKDTPADDEE